MRSDETPLGAPLFALPSAQESLEGAPQLARVAARRQVAHELERDVAKRGPEVVRVAGDFPFEARAGLAARDRHEPARLRERGLVDGELVRVEPRAEREQARLCRAGALVRLQRARVLGPQGERGPVQRPAALRRRPRKARQVARRQEHRGQAAGRGQPRDAPAVPVLLARAVRVDEPERRDVPRVAALVPQPHRDDRPGGQVLPRLGQVVRPERGPARDERERLEEVRLALPVVPDDEVHARVQLHPAVCQVPEPIGRERKNLHAADYILIGMTT